ncbi:Aldehyde dehydrogenase [Hondaea fermentalgiana]|uniref:Aldehyde dehydrogenase n=1 Tax=Hondaea fermentalgiana TaxID=2315210 RepID=A0A2R5G7U6_9STRA|nr:Aldehyde dehydrogenase [Hondaea fermentalgiana]|eukprot:GBG27122.1 Aldehyde dehydrogenase [Hondaea fermentalgiana]
MMNDDEVRSIVDTASLAQTEWRHASVQDRVDIVQAFLRYFEENADEVANDITGQMGKPLAHARGEIRGMSERAIAMMDLAPTALADYTLGETTNNQDTENFHRKIVREPVGVVLTLAPYNYPLLTAVNSIVPAVLAGNAVVVNHGFRTPLISEHFERAFKAAGVPSGLVVSQKCEYDVLHKSIRAGLYDFVSFTGSVEGGTRVQESVAACAPKFIDCTLELGGNDAAYVAEDANLDVAAATVVDGALFNAGQSCCGMERAFVHESVYDEFLDRAREEFHSAYGKVGDPRASETAMGPMAQPTAIPALAELVADAKAKGATVILGGDTDDDAGITGPRIYNPTLLADCDASMKVMFEESFGPVLAVQKVSSMDDAIRGVNASKYGLTSAIFTQDESAASEYASRVDVGTVFMNRADYLDPYMPWQGRKATGKGLSLSHHGFNAFTRLKNYHFKLVK